MTASGSRTITAPTAPNGADTPQACHGPAPDQGGDVEESAHRALCPGPLAFWRIVEQKNGSCKFFGDETGHSVRTSASLELSSRQAGRAPGGLTMARLRITWDDDEGPAINCDKERLDD